MWVWLAATALLFVLRAADVLRSVPLCFFLSAIAGALVYSLDQLRAMGSVHPLLRVRQTVLVLLIVAVPSLFDPSTLEKFNLPRFVVLLIAAAVIVADWAVDWFWSGWRPRRLVNGFQWVLLAIVVWFGITTLTSVEPRESFLGRDGSYEGFLLIAALAVFASALSESFDATAIPNVFRVVVASLVPVLVYGVIQLYGYAIDKHSTWDFVHWHAVVHNVFATMGNANHLAGYLVTFLPVGVVSALFLSKGRWQRAALWIWVAVATVLLLQTAARGAWLGALAATAILVIGLFGRIRARARTVVISATVGLGVVLALLAGTSGFLGAKAGALFRSGYGTSVSQRYGYWSAALRIAAHHPLTGSGPDTYSVVYTRYQDANLAREMGNIVVNGAHNIFLSWLANEGVPGFILIVALLGFGIAWALRTMRARRVTTNASGTTNQQGLSNLAVGLSACLLAYFVQASFDVEQVCTLFGLFLVVGLLGSTNRATWPVPDLVRLPSPRPRASQPEIPAASADSGYPLRSRPDELEGQRTRRDRRELGRTLGTFVAAALGNPAARRSAWGDHGSLRRALATVAVATIGLTAVGLTFWRADALWRADHQGQEGNFVQASTINPWEPIYLEYAGQVAVGTYRVYPKAPSSMGLLEQGVGYFRKAVDLDSYSMVAQTEYGSALQTLATAEHDNKALLRAALSAYRRAEQDDPYWSQLPGLVSATEKLLMSPR